MRSHKGVKAIVTLVTTTVTLLPFKQAVLLPATQVLAQSPSNLKVEADQLWNPWAGGETVIRPLSNTQEAEFEEAKRLSQQANQLYKQGQYGAAIHLAEKALAIYEKQLGPEHPDVATSLNYLAQLYQDQGRYSQAEPLLQKALAITEKQLGPEHTVVAFSLNNLAALHWATGDMAQAIAFQTRGNTIMEHNLTLNLIAGSETRKRIYSSIISGETDITISMHVQGAANNPQAARLALSTIVQRKGRILEALTDIYSTLRQHLTPENQALLEQLSATRSQISTSATKDLPFGRTQQQEYLRQVITLDEKAQELEATLSLHSESFRTQTQPVTIEAVQPLIPANAALVELQQYSPFNPKTHKRGTPRYVAYILHHSGDLQWVDLGEAQAINQAVVNFRRTVEDRTQSPAQVKQVARTLDALLMQPIRQHLGNSHHLLISPDSQLSLVPFAALVDEHDRYLVENYLITYLSSGRDLLKLQNQPPSQSTAVVVANPDFDHPGNQVISSLPNTRQSEKERGLELGLANLSFSSLIGLEQEAKAIAPLLPKVKVFTGANATKEVLKQLHGPEILHIATHGFFLSDEPQPEPQPVRGFSFLGERGSIRAIAQLGNPLLRSGLALAGANLHNGNDDGILTALEATNLDLRGTKLVVLSACETGLGYVVNGEGVYGLRRAFAIAGTETQVMSLWSAYDQTTKDLMVGYYQRLMNNVGRGEAMRQVQLEMLKSKEYQNPYYWAAFIASGDWRPIK